MDRYDQETEYQRGRHEIRMLIPDSYDGRKKYDVVYVLPVEAGFNSRFGYGLGVLEEAGAQNIHDIIIVQPAFGKEPWYGDHAENPYIRQASYLKNFLVPFIEGRYSIRRSPAGRLLLGFSKSGWGAFSLILKYPEFFGYAAAWDAPLMLADFQAFPGMREVYGTAGRLAEFRPDLLIPARKRFFQTRTRLVLAGEKEWGKSIPAPDGGSHTIEAHELLAKHGVRHHYDNTLNFPHRWDRRWLLPALTALLGLRTAGEGNA